MNRLILTHIESFTQEMVLHFHSYANFAAQLDNRCLAIAIKTNSFNLVIYLPFIFSTILIRFVHFREYDRFILLFNTR